MINNPSASATHLVLIPSYNTGPALLETANEALQFWRPVWVIIDGSTDGTGGMLSALETSTSGLKVISLAANQGKGAAVLTGLHAARAAGFRYALVMDADGQHPADRIPLFMRLSLQNPSAMILGEPDFGADAPLGRKYGRRIGNFWAKVETLWGGPRDSLFGFRVYPIQQSLSVLEGALFGRRYDFDTFLVVMLYWLGLQALNVKVPVKYFSAGKRVTHFRYLRDNVLLIRLHLWLLACMVPQVPALVRLRRRR